jgi:hypothetical protein
MVPNRHDIIDYNMPEERVTLGVMKEKKCTVKEY